MQNECLWTGGETTSYQEPILKVLVKHPGCFEALFQRLTSWNSLARLDSTQLGYQILFLEAVSITGL